MKHHSCVKYNAKCLVCGNAQDMSLISKLVESIDTNLLWLPDCIFITRYVLDIRKFHKILWIISDGMSMRRTPWRCQACARWDRSRSRPLLESQPCTHQKDLLPQLLPSEAYQVSHRLSQHTRPGHLSLYSYSQPQQSILYHWNWIQNSGILIFGVLVLVLIHWSWQACGRQVRHTASGTSGSCWQPPWWDTKRER